MNLESQLNRREHNQVLAGGAIGAVTGAATGLMVEGGLRIAESRINVLTEEGLREAAVTPADPVSLNRNENRMHFLATMGIISGTASGMIIGHRNFHKNDENAVVQASESESPSSK
jgi:hypothetical protein